MSASSSTTVAHPVGLRATTIMGATDVVDDETLHPGVVVWLAEPRLAADELDRFHQSARRAAMRRHPAGRARHLRAL